VRRFSFLDSYQEPSPVLCVNYTWRHCTNSCAGGRD